MHFQKCEQDIADARIGKLPAQVSTVEDGGKSKPQAAGNDKGKAKPKEKPKEKETEKPKEKPKEKQKTKVKQKAPPDPKAAQT